MSYGYVPPPPPDAPPPFPPNAGPYPPAPGAGPPKRSRAKLIVVSILGVVVLFVLFVAGILVLVFGAMKSSEPYQHAMQVVTHDQRAMSILGTPVKPGWFFNGSISVSGPSGSASLGIPVSGPRRKGTVYVEARKSAGQWTYQTLMLQLDETAETVDLLPPHQDSK